MPEGAIDSIEGIFATEREQFAYDQSVSNDENTGMLGAMFGNIVLLVVIVGVIVFALSRKKKS